MTALERLIQINMTQAVGLAKAGAYLAASARTVTELEAEIVRLKGEVTMLQLDLAEVREGRGS
jgi:hypothetical protein